MRRTIIARTTREVLELRYLWDKLESQDPATMFQTFDWNYAVAAAFADRESPFVIYTESDNGVALIPGVVDRKAACLTLLGETLFDYRDVLWSGDEQVLQAAWNLASQSDLNFSAGAIRADAKLSNWTGFALNSFYGAPKVSPKAISSDEFASRHNRLARWHRRMLREGVELRCRTGADSEVVRFIYRQKGSQRVETGDNLFQDPRRVQFMVDVCGQVRSACEIFTFETAGTLVAAIVTFRDRQVRRFYTTYFDQRWARYSPGIVLLHHVTRHSLAAGLECDYMTGEHAYKLRFATSTVPMFWAGAGSGTLGSLGEFHASVAA